MYSGKVALRVAAVAMGALVAGAVAAPAYAQSTTADLEISLVGTTISADVSGKFGTVTLTNHGPDDATGIEFSYDFTALDDTKVVPVIEDCPPEDGIAVCVLEPDGILSGQHLNFLDFLQVVPGGFGDAGAITLSIMSHDSTDPDLDNNSVTVPVVIEGAGPDLLVVAPDVHDAVEFNLDELSIERLDSPVVPGSDALVEVFVANQGDQPTAGLQMNIELPEHVTFTFPELECTHAEGDSTTTCDYSTINLQPGYNPDDDPDYCVNSGTCGWFFFPVRVAEDAPSPAGLTGTADAWDAQAGPQLLAATAPRNFTQDAPVDVDPSDNVSAFTVFVSEVPGDGGTGGGDGDDDGDKGGDDQLPVTGAPALLIGVAGTAVLAAGALLFFVARRRKVVTAAPDTDG